MHITSVTLLGFVLTTICTSICPMNMGLDSGMPVHHEGVHMTEHAMHMGDHEEMPCSHCEQDEDKLATPSTQKIAVKVAAEMPFTSFVSVLSPSDIAEEKQSRVLLANGPPFTTKVLVETVVMRM